MDPPSGPRVNRGTPSDLHERAADRLAAYAALLRSWAPKLDLISPADLSRLEERHLEDSLQALPLLAGLGEGWAVDVGSGAGLPGIPLAICGSPDLRWRLLEPRKRRAAFLEEAVRELDLDCEVLVITAEEASMDPALAATHAIGVGRALAPPEEALGLIAPLVKPGGLAAVFLGEQGEVPAGAEGRPGGLAIIRIEAGRS